MAKLGTRLLSDVADKECYSAKLFMMYLHMTRGHAEPDTALARMWAERAKALHPTLTAADDLCDAGHACHVYSSWFGATDQDALMFWEKAAALGSGLALWRICETTRASQGGTHAWLDKLSRAAALGETQAMVELAEQKGVRGTEQERVWLRAAAALGSLRAQEMLEHDQVSGK